MILIGHKIVSSYGKVLFLLGLHQDKKYAVFVSESVDLVTAIRTYKQF